MTQVCEQPLFMTVERSCNRLNRCKATVCGPETPTFVELFRGALVCVVPEMAKSLLYSKGTTNLQCTAPQLTERLLLFGAPVVPIAQPEILGSFEGVFSCPCQLTMFLASHQVNGLCQVSCYMEFVVNQLRIGQQVSGRCCVRVEKISGNCVFSLVRQVKIVLFGLTLCDKAT